MDKVGRVLGLFWQLYNGLKINKDSFCLEMGIDKRTFERDIEDIRNFLSEMYIGQDISYDRRSNVYYMTGTIKRLLTEVEYTAIITILLGSRGLRKDEMEGLVHSLERVSEHVGLPAYGSEKEIYGKYQENLPVNALLKMQWDLYQCIKRHLVIRIHYLESDICNNETEEEVIPKAVFFDDNHFMLKALRLQTYADEKYYVEQIQGFEVLRAVSLQENRLYFNNN